MRNPVVFCKSALIDARHKQAIIPLAVKTTQESNRYKLPFYTKCDKEHEFLFAVVTNRREMGYSEEMFTVMECIKFFVVIS